MVFTVSPAPLDWRTLPMMEMRLRERAAVGKEYNYRILQYILFAFPHVRPFVVIFVCLCATKIESTLKKQLLESKRASPM